MKNMRQLPLVSLARTTPETRSKQVAEGPQSGRRLGPWSSGSEC